MNSHTSQMLDVSGKQFEVTSIRKFKMNNNYKSLPLEIKVSMYIAFVGGILTPFLETIRRWHQMSDLHYFISWFDDYLIGGFLFFAAWKTFKSSSSGIRYLIAAWGFASGMIFYSFFSQLQTLDQRDPAPVSSTTVAFIKGGMFLICITSLILSLKSKINHFDKKKL